MKILDDFLWKADVPQVQEGQCEGCMEYGNLVYDAKEKKWLCANCIKEDD